MTVVVPDVTAITEDDDGKVESVNGPDDIVDTVDSKGEEGDDDGEDLADRTGSVFVPYIRRTQSCSVARPKLSTVVGIEEPASARVNRDTRRSRAPVHTQKVGQVV